MHEADLSDENCFLTLTFNDDHVPSVDSFRYDEFQAFMKRLRQYVRRRDIASGLPKEKWHKVRFYMCGEYGEKSFRPHYHALIFGFDFPDKVPLRYSGHSLYSRSADLEKLWTFGNSVIGQVTFESAAYVARYVMKKVNGKRHGEHYREKGVVDSDGVVQAAVPEFSRMSLRPGIGAGWIDKFTTDVYPSGRVVSRGREFKSPRYYDMRIKAVDPDVIEELALVREVEGRKRFADNTDERLAVRRRVAEAKVRLSRRDL